MRVTMFIASQYGLMCYKAVKSIADIEVVGILTTPSHFILKYEKDKTKEMDNTIYQDVIEEGKSNNIPVYITTKINDEKTVEIIQKWKPDLIVVSGWYHIMKEKILSIPPKGVIGLHSSLLPRYRGGAPLVWQLINGETKSGITLFYMERGTDTGDIIGQKEVNIEYDDDIGTLYKKVGEKGIELLKEYIPQIADDCAPRRKQEIRGDNNFFPQRKKEDGQIDWSKEPTEIYNFVRAQTRPYPGAFSMYDGHMVYIWKCKDVKIRQEDYPIGTIVGLVEKREKIYPIISTGKQGGGIEVLEYSLPGGDTNIQIEKWKKFI